MTESNPWWMIRTTNHQIFGPVSRKKLIELIRDHKILPDDAICAGNGFWFYLKNKEFLDYYLYQDLPQPFWPIGEAKDRLTSHIPTTAHLPEFLNANPLPLDINSATELEEAVDSPPIDFSQKKSPESNFVIKDETVPVSENIRESSADREFTFSFESNSQAAIAPMPTPPAIQAVEAPAPNSLEGILKKPDKGLENTGEKRLNLLVFILLLLTLYLLWDKKELILKGFTRLLIPADAVAQVIGESREAEIHLETFGLLGPRIYLQQGTIIPENCSEVLDTANWVKLTININSSLASSILQKCGNEIDEIRKNFLLLAKNVLLSSKMIIDMHDKTSDTVKNKGILKNILSLPVRNYAQKVAEVANFLKQKKDLNEFNKASALLQSLATCDVHFICTLMKAAIYTKNGNKVKAKHMFLQDLKMHHFPQGVSANARDPLVYEIQNETILDITYILNIIDISLGGADSELKNIWHHFLRSWHVRAPLLGPLKLLDQSIPEVKWKELINARPFSADLFSFFVEQHFLEFGAADTEEMINRFRKESAARYDSQIDFVSLIPWYIPKEDQLREKIFLSVEKWFQSEDLRMRYRAIQALEVNQFRDLFFKRYPQLSKPIFVLKRNLYFQMLERNIGSTVAFFKLLSMGEIPYMYFYLLLPIR